MFYKARQKAAKIEQSNAETKQVIAKPIEEIKAKGFLSITDTCKLLGISCWTIWRIIKKEEIKAVKIGKRVVISRESINSLFNI